MTPTLRAALPPLLAASLAGCCCATGDLDTVGNNPRLEIQPPATTTDSDAAAPTWAQDHRKAAPQTPDADRIFTDLVLEPRVASLDRDLILCRATSSADTDAGHPPDLTLQVTFGTRTATIIGPGDTSELTFSIPLVTAQRDDPVKVIALDRDPGSTEPAGSFEGTFAGLPFNFEGKDFTMTCRGKKRIEVELEMILAWRRFEATHRDLKDTLHPNPKSPDWGRQDTHLDELQKDIEAMAALVGWSDSRVQTKLDALGQAEARWDALVAQSIEAFIADKRPGHKATLPDEGLTFEIKTWACAGHKHLAALRNNAPETLGDKASAAPCLISAEITNTGVRPIRALGATGRLGDLASISMVGPKGLTVPVSFYPLLDGGNAADFTLGPDAAQLIVLVPHGGADDLSLVQLKSRRGLVWVAADGAR